MKHASPLATAALVALLFAPSLAADPSASPSIMPSALPGAAERERLQRQLEQQRDLALERLRLQHAPARPSGSTTAPPPAMSPLPNVSAKAATELADKWQRIVDTRLERRERQRSELVRNVGTRLADPRVREELKLHAKRTAELRRLKFLAENARTGAVRESLLARISKLSASEDGRHRKRMQALVVAAAPAASASSRAVGARPAASKVGGKP
jgi:hypothetical protein